MPFGLLFFSSSLMRKKEIKKLFLQRYNMIFIGKKCIYDIRIIKHFAIHTCISYIISAVTAILDWATQPKK